MKILTARYWRSEWAGLWAGKWNLAAFTIAWYFTANTIMNNGYIKFEWPGVTGIYYFGFSPAIWGFLSGVFIAKAFAVGKNAAKVRYMELLEQAALRVQNLRPLNQPLPVREAKPGDFDYENPEERMRKPQ